jgi:uncharacterized membrane protein (GlpM family)
MKISIDTARLGESRWYEYLVRFIFGGSVTALAGLVAKHYGPTVGGLFLAFPAIFPATATLIEKHEKEKKKNAGNDGTVRARMAVGMDALGAAIGALALTAFALLVWRGLPRFSPAFVLVSAMAVWMIVAWLGWMTWEFSRKRERRRRQRASKQDIGSSLHASR